jgi:hypothetical protein
MKIGKPPSSPSAKTPRPPVRAGGQKTSQARAIVDGGETRGAAAITDTAKKGRVGRALGTTGKGPPPASKAPGRLRVPQGPGVGMLPGIAGPAPPMAPPMLAIGERPRLGARTRAALAKRRGR